MTNSSNGKNGVALVAFVMVIAIVGIFLGIGRLRTHENAVKRRLERTYQVEKMLATRDSLTIANTVLKGSSENAYTNEFSCLNFGDTLLVAVEPVKPVDVQEMDDMGADSGWATFSNSDKAKVTQTTSSNGTFFNFTAPMVATNIPFRAAVIRKAVCPWFDSEFGYLYTLDIHEGQSGSGGSDHIGKLRLYLIGLTMDERYSTPHWSADNKSGLDKIAADFNDVLSKRPWICMEVGIVGTAVDENAKCVRNMYIHDYGDNNGRCFFRTNVIHSPEDKLYQPGGFLVSSTAFCCFGVDSKQTKLFSARWDLTRNVTKANFDAHAFTNAFRESAIAIEHVFPTNAPSDSTTAEERSVTIDSFVMREPLTYAVRTFNPKVTSEKGRDIMTWIFQTKEPFPDATGDEDLLGEQCILDTFGREPTSLRMERTGRFLE